jgi:hypothetical protein
MIGTTHGTIARVANDTAGEAFVALPHRPSITLEELKVLQPVIEALVMMAANDLCATTLSSGEL